MNEQQRELALRIAQEMPWNHAHGIRQDDIEEYARRLFAAWQESRPHLYAAPVASADALDAKRYRWLRTRVRFTQYFNNQELSLPLGKQVEPAATIEHGESVDAEIDAAMQEKHHD